MISANSIQDIRDRADIVEVVGNFLSLKRRGANYLANCPFHNEKTPSFNVNPSKGIYKCFGCGKAGDAVNFIQEYEKFSFVEALRWLAEFYNIELEETKASTEVQQHRQVEESLRIIFQFAIEYFQSNLFNTEEGRIVGLGYFKQRGFSQRIIEQFQLGYAIDSWDDFLNHAIKQGYSKELLVKAGLITDKNERTYDTYRGRVIFPILSNTGKVVGLGARILVSNTKAPKYINSPESKIYNKSKILYGLYQSRNAISKLDECILVEGYTDVISLHQHGVENVVSSSGTSLTEGQLKLLKNLTKNLTILYDGDAAGIKAALRGMQLALAEGYNVNIVQLPPQEDPDSYVQQHGEKAFRNYLEANKKDVISFQITSLHEIDKLSPVEKSQVAQEVAETIAKIDKAELFVLQQEYVKKAATLMSIDENGLIQLVNKKIHDQQRAEQKKWVNEQEANHEIDPMILEYGYPVDADAQTSSPSTIDSSSNINPSFKAAWKVVQMLLKYGDKPYDEQYTVAQYFFDRFDIDSLIEDPLCLNVIKNFQVLFFEDTPLDKIEKHFTRHDDQQVKNKIIELLLDEEQPNPKWESQIGLKLPTVEETYLDEVKSSFAYFELINYQNLIKIIMEEMKVDTDPASIQENMLVLQDLKLQEKSFLNLVVKRPL